MSDPLDPAALISTLPTLLPPNAQTLPTQYDALAALLHTAMISLSFRLVALDDTSPAQEMLNSTLPESWNRGAPESFAFRYKHDQSSLVFFLKIVKLGTRTLIHGLALESGTTQTLDLLTSDYMSASFFPYSPTFASPAPLVHGFISSARVKDLVALYKINILQKLVPGLRKEGYQEAPAVTAPAAERGSASRDPPRNDPTPFAPFRGSNQPDDYDPLRIPSVGRRDLDPIAGNPFNPPSLFGGEDDGMFVGPNHPLFRDRGGTGGAAGGGRMGPWGGDGFLPPMGAPPGARFDPIGPGPRGGGPLGGFPGPSRGGPFGGGGAGGGRPFSGEPDNDEFMPPGADDMYS